MLSLEQLAQMVKEHLGLCNYIDGIHHTCKWMICESSLGGRGLVATEDISAGEVLFVDHPLVYGPRAGTIIVRGCTVCGKIDSETFFKCPKCALLLCSKQCQNTNTHYDDCGIISRWRNKTPLDNVDDVLLSRALTAIRCLLLNQNQRQLMISLQGHTLPQHGSEIQNLEQFFDIPDEEKKLMSLACCVLDTNAFQIATPYGKKEMSMRGLYPVSGLMNHNCISNTRYSFNDDFQMTLKAVKPITAGNEIHTCYSGVLWGTPARRTHLYKTKHFLCKCDRCADPTECGTLLGALKCFSNQCQGCMVPIEPLKTSSAWRCLDCAMRVPNSNICAIQGALGSLMSTLNFENVDELEKFLMHRITKYIPRTNQIVIDLQCRLIWAFGEVEGFRWHVAIFITGHVHLCREDWPRQSAAVRLRTQHALKRTAISTPVGTPLPRNMERLYHEETTLLKGYLEDPTCAEWVIKQSDLGGRGLFATKLIKKGTLIFTNKPMVMGSRADQAGKTYCSVCFQITNFCHPCDKCSFNVCSEECNKHEEHIIECNFITANWKTKPDCKYNSNVLARMQIYLRFLLLKDEHKVLLPIFQNFTSDSMIEELQILCSMYVLPEEDIQFIKMVHSIIRVNSFRIANNPQDNKVPLRGLYPLSALLNHSCVPNTRNVFNKYYTMDVYATEDINKDEEILTCYTGLLWCTPARRCQLYKTKRFWCKCKRCKDSTELGTNLSALKCFNKECVGVLLPGQPLDPRQEWCCDNCGFKPSTSKVCTVQSVLGSLVGVLDLDNEFRLDTSILGRLAEFVPYSSHIFVDLRLRLALRVGFTKGLALNALSESRLALKESLCRGTLRTLAALGAGDAHLRGLLLYHLHAALAERARRSPDLYEELKSEIESTIEQACNILQGDISAPPDLELRRRYLGPGCDKPQEERFFILDAR